MILQWFANTFKEIVFALLGWVNIPSPDFFNEIISVVDMAISNGMSLLVFFIPSYVIQSSITIFLVLETFKYGYFLVMWILRKIPAVGIN